MLHITIPARDQWDESKNLFVETSKKQDLQLEHSLLSIRKWESKWCKVFLSDKEKTVEETIDYVRCMTLTQNVDYKIYECLTKENLKDVEAYMKAKMTAIYFPEEKGGKVNREQVTTELIYYWMISLNIPIQCEKWHLNQLFNLIRVCNMKNQPAKKRHKKEILSRQAAMNEARRKQLNTKG